MPYLIQNQEKSNYTIKAPVKWTQSVQQMITDGATLFTVGPGKSSWINWKN
jgi:[acyl-carrier-protein] S-malonyltransferase